MKGYSTHKVPQRKDSTLLRVLVSYTFLAVVAGGLFYLLLSLELPEAEFLISFFVILGILLYSWYRFETEMWHRAWQKTADKFGFKYVKDKISALPSLEGSYKGRSIQIRGFRQAVHRKRESTHTAIWISLNARIAEELGIYQNGWLFRKKDTTLEIGDKDFNKKISVKTSDEAFAKKLLSSATLRQGLKDIGNSQMQILISSDRLYFAEKSYMLDREYLQAVLDILVTLADEVDRYSRYAPAIDEFKKAVPSPNDKNLQSSAAYSLNRQNTKKKGTGKTSMGIIFTLVALFGCLFASIAITDGSFQVYASVFIAFVTLLFIAFSWDKIPGTAHYQSQRTVDEIKTLLREKLLPLGYKEIQSDPRFPSPQGFLRDNILVNVFEHKINKTLNFEISDTSQKPYTSQVSVEKHFRKNEAFKAETIREFYAWLETQLSA